LVSLFVFQSTLSLNSVLGVILLNGIAVANSIILVDFLKRLVDQGMDPTQAAIEAGKKRLRPILITSLTTILGMLPIAIGMGEGGRILQPLGIAVSGGLWVSMGLTLFVVPALQVSYLTFRSSRKKFGRPEVRVNTVTFVSGAIVADEVAAEAFNHAEGARRDKISSDWDAKRLTTAAHVEPEQLQ
jgi:predicted RND superfamily exporter protein